MADWSVRKSFSQLLLKLFGYAVKRTNDKYDMREVQQKYYLQKGKTVQLDINDMDFKRVFYIEDGHTQMVEPQDVDHIDCTIAMSAQTVVDIINGESSRMMPNGSWGKIPYDPKVAWSLSEITVDQASYWLSDGQYFINTFLKELLPEIREALGGKMPRIQ